MQLLVRAVVALGLVVAVVVAGDVHLEVHGHLTAGLRLRVLHEPLRDGAEAEAREADRARGKISWHSRIKVYGDPMRTVALNYVEAFRNAE